MVLAVFAVRLSSVSLASQLATLKLSEAPFTTRDSAKCGICRRTGTEILEQCFDFSILEIMSAISPFPR